MTRVGLQEGALRAFQVALSILVLGLTASLVDLGEVRTSLLRLSIGWVLVSLGFQGVQVVIVATRWYWINRQLGSRLTWGRALHEYIISVSLNQLVPGGFAGDVVRGYRQTKSETQPMRAWLGVIADRVVGQVALWVIAAVSAPLWLPVALSSHLPAARVAFVALPLVLLVVLLLAARLVSRRHPTLRKDFGVVMFHLRSPVVLAGHLLLAASLMAAWVASFYCASRALGSMTPGSDVVRSAVPALLAASVPGFVNGWGAREGAAALAYDWAGLSATEGSAVAVTYGVVGLISAILGLVLLLPRGTTAPTLIGNWTRTHALVVLSATGVSVLTGSVAVLAGGLGLSFVQLLVRHRGSYTKGGAFGAANAVTALRLVLVLLLLSGVLVEPLAVIALAVVIMGLDGLDGWIARRTGSASVFGAHFDMEVDAAFMLTIAWMLAEQRELGLWALIPGLWRYVFVVIALTFRPPNEPPRTPFSRASFVVSMALQLAALGVATELAWKLALGGVVVVSASFMVSLWHSYFGAARRA